MLCSRIERLHTADTSVPSVTDQPTCIHISMEREGITLRAGMSINVEKGAKVAAMRGKYLAKDLARCKDILFHTFQFDSCSSASSSLKAFSWTAMDVSRCDS